MTAIGQMVTYSLDDGNGGYEQHAAIIGRVISGDTCDLAVIYDGTAWPNGAFNYIITQPAYAIPKGTGVGTWQETSVDVGPQGEKGDKGDTGDTGATGPAGADGAGFGTITENTPTRALGTAFQVSSTRPAQVSYSARIVSTISLTGGQSGRVELLSDASNPPTTVRKRVAGGATGTLTVGLSISDTAEAPLDYLVPAGHYVLLRSVNETGTPTYSLTAQVEEIL